MDFHIKLTIDDRLVAAVRRVRSVLSVRRAALALLLAVSGAAVVVAAPLSKPHSFNAGDPIRASDINENFDALYDELDARVIRTDKTIEVADCSALQTALQALADRRIDGTATVTFALPAGTFACESGSGIVVDHPDGNHVAIIGKGSAETTLTFQNAHGIFVPMSRSLGLVDRMTISSRGGTGFGVMVQGAGSARLGSGLVVREFDNGVYAESSVIYADGVISEDNSQHGFFALAGGVIWAKGAIARENLLDGFFAAIGATIMAESATADTNTRFGFDAAVGSAMQTVSAKSMMNTHGFNANANSSITADRATSSDKEFGFAAWNDSYIEALDPVANSTPFAGYSARFGSYMYLTSPGGTALTYSAPGANMWSDAEGNMVQVVE